MPLSRHFLVWGKSSADSVTSTSRLGHLQDHLMAVVAVTQALLELPRFAQVARRLLTTMHPSPTVAALAKDAPLAPEEAWPYLWAAAVHDLGKLTFPFQAKQGKTWLPLLDLGGPLAPSCDLAAVMTSTNRQALARAWQAWDLQFSPTCSLTPQDYLAALQCHGGVFKHGEVGDAVTWELHRRLRWLTQSKGPADEAAWLWRHLARAAFAHHGARLNDAPLIETTPEQACPQNEVVWGPAGTEMARYWLPRMETLATFGNAQGPAWQGWTPTTPLATYVAPQGLPALAHWVAGLITVADWLGSGLAQPGNGPTMQALTASSLQEPAWAFAGIVEQHRRWGLATGPAHPAQATAQGELIQQWDALLTSARQRVHDLFHTEIGLAQHHAQLSVATGLWFGVAPEAKDALTQWRTRLRPLQHAMADLDVPMGPGATPRLVLLEAPMGEGKTEAAEIMVNRLIQSGAATGAIFALPTEASTTRLRDRVGAYAADLLAVGGTTLSSQAAAQQASGQAAWLRRQTTQAHPDFQAAEQAGDLSRQAAHRFFTAHNKRSFLNAFTVCTVDQVEMAVMPTRHAQVRALGLAGRVLVVDEAHAYDAYMRNILVEAIRLVARMGGWTIILSATLPSPIRQQLLEAYADPGTPSSLNISQAYPLLTHVGLGDTMGQVVSQALPPSKRQEQFEGWLQLEGQATESTHWTERFPSAWAHVRAVVQGPERGCAVILCNTIARAQAVYAEVSAWAAAQDESIHVDLLHSRFRRLERQAKEEALLAWAGKDSTPALRAGRILVATQVVEQSLDLDFDVMVTDVAPIDLLLQRTGRLHRHARAFRPEAARRAICHVVVEHALDASLFQRRELETLLAERTPLHAQVIPYVNEHSFGSRHTVTQDTEIMANTLNLLLTADGPCFPIPPLRQAVDAVYVGRTLTDQVRDRSAYAHRITVTPEVNQVLAPRTTGVGATPPSAETRPTERDTLAVLILEQTPDGRWRPPAGVVGQGGSLPPGLAEGFEDLLAKAGQVGLNGPLVDQLQSWVLPVPVNPSLARVLAEHRVLDPEAFQALMGREVDRHAPNPLPFHVVRGYEAQGQIILGTRGGPLYHSPGQMTYSAATGLSLSYSKSS